MKGLEQYMNLMDSYIESNTTKEATYEDATKTHLFPHLRILPSNFEQQSKTKNGQVDFLIKIGNKKIPLEIKPFEKKLGSNFKKGRTQLAKYIWDIGGDYGILSDTKRWEFIKIRKSQKKYKIIWSYKIGSNKKDDLKFLQCLSKHQLVKFLTFADATFGSQGFEKILQLTVLCSEEELLSFFSKKKVNSSSRFLKLLKSEIINTALKENQSFKQNEWKNFA